MLKQVAHEGEKINKESFPLIPGFKLFCKKNILDESQQWGTKKSSTFFDL